MSEANSAAAGANGAAGNPAAEPGAQQTGAQPASGNDSGNLLQRALAAGGKPAAPSGQGGQGEGAQAQAQEAGQAPPAGSGTQRPEHVPEQFWDAEQGRVKHEAWAKSWNDFRQLAKAPASPPPENAAGYALSDEQAGKLDLSDPVLGVFRDLAFENRLSNEQFQAIVGGFLQKTSGLVGQPQDAAAERAKLGPHADAITNSVSNHLQRAVNAGNMTADQMQRLVAMNGDAAGIQAMHSLISALTGEQAIPSMPPAGRESKSPEECYNMMNDPRYRNGDPAYIAEVERAFEETFGTSPRGTSDPGLGVRPRQQVASK